MSLRPDIEIKEGWREFVAREELRPPERWSRARYDEASPEARARYDDERRRYHGGFGPILHGRAQSILGEMQRQLRVNRYARELPLLSFVLDGDSFLGKSTMLRTLGWLYERQNPPTAATGSLIDPCPVVNISLNADMKIVDLNEVILRFLGSPLPARGRNSDLTRPALDAIRNADVQLVLIDELNFLKKRFVKHDAVNDHIKWMMNHFPATMAFAGIDCSASSALVTARQTSKRLKWFNVEPFSVGDETGKREWQQLLVAVEHHFTLFDAPPRMLSGEAAMRAYLHRRSNGSLGTLLSLLRSGADKAMETGHERLDIQLLNTVSTEHGAEQEQLQREAGGAMPASRGAGRGRTAASPRNALKASR